MNERVSKQGTKQVMKKKPHSKMRVDVSFLASPSPSSYPQQHSPIRQEREKTGSGCSRVEVKRYIRISIEERDGAVATPTNQKKGERVGAGTYPRALL